MTHRHYSRITWALLASVYFSFSSSIPHSFAQPTSVSNEAPEGEIAKDSNTEINVKNADIAAIVRIFSRKTKRNYILDEKVRGKVSIYLPGKVSAEESLRILDSVLALKGFSTVPIGDNLWKIVPAKEARQSTIPTRVEGRNTHPSSSVITRLVALKYVSSQDVQQIVSQLVSGDGLVNAYTGTNSLILIDQEDNIERLLKIIDQLDVPFSNREMTIVPIKHADVQDISQKLNDILGESSSKDKSAADPVRASMSDPNQAAQAQAQRPQGIPGSGKTISARGLVPKIIPDQRTNSLIIVADDETTARIRALVSQLDSKVDLSGNKFYVYRCQHANAEELSQVLAGLVGGGGSGMMGGFGSSSSSGSGMGGMFDQNSGFGQNRTLGSQNNRNGFGRSTQGMGGGFGSSMGGMNRSGGGGIGQRGTMSTN